MKKSNIILSICVPTYNRCTCITRLLETIIDEIRGFEDYIEICISDNCSIDNTQKVIKEYTKKYNFIKYRKNLMNLGFDLNILNVLSMASGEYCWLIGDDDNFLKKSITKTLKILRTRKYDYLLTEYTSYNSESMLNWDGQSDITNINDFTKDIIIKINPITYMGVHIIRRTLFLNIKPKLENDANGFIHISILFHLLKDTKRICIIKKPSIITLSDGKVITIREILSWHLNLSNTFSDLKKDHIITAEDYNYTINSIYRKFYLVLLFANSVYSKGNFNENKLITTRIYNRYIKGTPSDGILMKMAFIITKNNSLLTIARFFIRIIYTYFYIGIMNYFRKFPKPLIWEVQKQNLKNGGRECFFFD